MDVRRERLTLLATCFGLFMIMLANTIVNVALPSIKRELHTSPETLAFGSSYVIGFLAAGAVLLTLMILVVASAFMTGFGAAMWTAAALTLLAAAVALMGLRGARAATQANAGPA